MSESTFDINTATVQEACDYAVKQIVKQGKRCMGDFSCLYDDGNGNHCAIGWLLPDKFGDFDSWIYNLRDKGLLPDVIHANIDLFGLLQSFHDSPSSKERATTAEMLKYTGIDTSGSHWQQWVEMGEVA